MKVFIIYLAILFLCGATFGQGLNGIYVHTDRAAYSPGDTVWFKGYVLKDGHLDRSAVNLFVDWADSDTIIRNDVFLVGGGVAPGQFVIPINYRYPMLELNAFTRNMVSHRHFGYYRSLVVFQDSLETENFPQDTFLKNSLTPSSADKSHVEMNVLFQPDTIKISLRSLVSYDIQNLMLECIFQYVEVFSNQIDLQSRAEMTFKLPRYGIDSGVLQFRLINEKSRILCHYAKLLIDSSQMITPKIGFNGTGEPTVSLPNGELANLSIAITKKNTVIGNSKSMYGELLLNNTADKSYPDLYHVNNKQVWQWNNQAEIPQLRDSVLYLKGKLNFSEKVSRQYEKALANLTTKKKRDLRGLSVGFRPLADTLMQFSEYTLNVANTFEIPNLTFFDSIELRIKQIEPSLQYYPFDAICSFYPIERHKTIYRPSWATFENQESRLLSIVNGNERSVIERRSFQNMRRLQTVVVKRDVNTQRIALLEKEHGISGPFKSVNAYAFDAANDPLISVSSDARSYLSSKLPHVNIGSGRMNRGDNIRLFINETPSEFSELEYLFADDLSYIKFFQPPSILNPSGGAALAVYTKKGNQYKRSSLAKAFTAKVMGYTEPLAKSISLKEETIYWQPMALLSVLNPYFTIPLNKSELKNTTLTIEGVTESGKIVYLQTEMDKL
ncbi:MAG: hypothetical protein LBV59_23805 [Sphingobacterium sp.]|jgi:hypothetical protein|uniref:hypothetical protein n=1 Tax=Sphingobacterium sp. TaxID=341027 RepID=UPI00283CFFD2|nr:hypothetical protein [Sphingobacterium sp.]MDR3010973.1 hypothetical protein [Sphingobacterium sp.]